jgi:hypothetical protein
MLGNLQAFVSEHLAHGIDRDTIVQSHRGGKRMPGHMISKALLNAADISDLL